MLKLFVLVAAGLFFSSAGTLPASAQQADLPGAADHALVGRYDGSAIDFFETKAYEELRLPFKALESGEWQRELAGKLTSIRYKGPGDRSILEVMRNYETALKANGFEIVFFCRGRDECSPKQSVSAFWDAARGGIGMPTTWDTTIYLLAERNDADGLVTVGMLGVETQARGDIPLTPHVAVTVVESQPMETDRITLVEASAMEEALAKDGKIAIYGIYFDFDKADIKPESQPQIDQLGELLKTNQDLQAIIVGHTDGQGAFDYNLSLSQQRAQAVVDALVASYGIAPGRLIPAGAGMLSPVASNRTEEGRAKNRRVEIVERYTGG
ncbi:OmpA family protein [Chelativorans xinjiangense]|uniref:OmpA family protein n=1 Tax=Chelativorans xinjiangense TaxID=2681485 RepID=UPI00135AF328|nr:OmpA family protein [Chelativorans xinjiangense]